MADTGKIVEYDRTFLPRLVGGVDEAGRGPLAGPVVAACAVMPLDSYINGVFDSKQVSEHKREILYERIVSEAIAYGVGIADNTVIDSVNILNATKQAMAEAFNALKVKPSLLLVDAVKNLDIDCETLPIIKGDATSYNIAAASIIAKVTRDRIMREYDLQYPQYAFVKNKGYGTKAHIAALTRFGACSLHRITFIKNFIGGNLQENEKKA